MGTLREPTIEGFVDKLIEDNHIGALEIGDVQKTLERATDQMTSEEKVNFIKVLSNRVDAPASNLITPNGLNYAVFESAVKEVSKSIETKRIDKEKQSNKNNNEENLIQEMTAAEREKKEWEEKVLENEDFIDGFFSDFIGIDIEWPQEAKREMAENMVKAAKLDKQVKMYEDKGYSQEESLDLALKDLGMTKEDLNSTGMKVAQVGIYTQMVDEYRKQGHTEEEISEIMKKQSSLSARTVNKWIEKSGIKEFWGAAKLVGLSMVNEWQREKVNEQEALVRSNMNSSSLKISELKEQIKKREKLKDNSRIVRRELNVVTNEISDNNKLNDLFKDLADEYLATGTTISSIFEKYKETEEFEGLEFGDVLDGIKNELSKDVSITYGEVGLLTLIEHENECRIVDLVLQELKNIEEIKQGTLLNEENSKCIAEYRIQEQRLAERLKKLKSNLIEKRGINLEDRKWKEIQTISIDVAEKKEVSLEQLLENRNKVNNDRNAIIRIAKDKKVSSDIAAKEYFEKNPEALSNYTKKEKEILLGKQDKSSELGKNRVLKSINVFLINRNEKSMERNCFRN